jgi:LAS superfamily LD-carboxypeptidase LdcB
MLTRAPRLTYPTGVDKTRNGRLFAGELAPLLRNPARGALHPLAARAFNVLCLDMQAAGYDLIWTARPYRSYQEQETLFRSRYRPTKDGAKNIAKPGEPPRYDARTWNGRTWWRYTGAAAAVPGRSNHGLGIAVDVCLPPFPRGTPITRAALAVLAVKAPPCGFYWPMPSDEPWHIEYSTGDKLPTHVLDVERFLNGLPA